MTMDVSGEIVIRGITAGGKVFRPSDWAERLAGAFSIMGPDHRIHYSECVQPILRAGLRCVAIKKSLEQRSPAMYNFLMDFARSNDLDVVEGRSAPRE
jgi:hypothetical protein